MNLSCFETTNVRTAVLLALWTAAPIGEVRAQELVPVGSSEGERSPAGVGIPSIDQPRPFLDCNGNGQLDRLDVLGTGRQSVAGGSDLAIPDASPSGVSDTVNVRSSSAIADVDVRLELDHTFNGDLTVLLEHGGFAAILLAGPGREVCSEAGGYDDDGLKITVDDEGRPGLHLYREEVGVPSGRLRGRWQPDLACGESALSVFDGLDAAGPWTLTVIDEFGGETGMLRAWSLDIFAGPPLSGDCNRNGVPDECEPDCNGNLIPDSCEADCNRNGLADDCDIALGTSLDLNLDGVPDECEVDCNQNGVPDDLDIQSGLELDGNDNGTPDACDIASGSSSDLQGDGIPDELQLGPNDCNQNQVPDDAEIALGLSEDCNQNGRPDECDIAFGFSDDLDFDGRPDECGLASNPPFQILGIQPGQAGEDEFLLVDTDGLPSMNPFDYCVQLEGGRGVSYVTNVFGDTLEVFLEGVPDPGVGSLLVAPGFGGPIPPFSDASIQTEDGHAFTGFGDAARSGLFDTRATPVGASRLFRLRGKFDPAENGGTLTIPVVGRWQAGDKMRVYVHSMTAGGNLWDFSEVITFTADGTTRACAQRIVDRYNAVAAAAGCNCNATLTAAPKDEIKVTCAGGVAASVGGVVLKEWVENDVNSVIGEFDTKRDGKNFVVENTVGGNTDTVTVPITRVKQGDKIIEYGCKYETNVNGRAGNMKIVSASGSDDIRIVQTVKGSRTLKRAGVADRNLLPNLADFALDGGTAANPDYNARGVGWPLTRGLAILDFVSSSSDPATAGQMEGDKICFNCEFQTFILCDDRAIGFISWTTSAELTIGATPAMSAWTARPAVNASWVPRDMRAGSGFRDALNHLNTLVDSDFD